MRNRAIVLGALMVMGVSVPVSAGAWELIGKKNVTDRLDHDIIFKPGPRRFAQIRLCVSRNPVRFYDVDVRFANGGHQDVKIARRIEPGHCTRATNLKGPGPRDLRSVKFLYEESSLKLRRATVRLFAR
ncbi:hypothetical protein [Nitratireductor aquibiodomus]|uniref:hypothetical protein n=1 Tax=Nitratireductor aquibiodomus TaxID=204799 RepID=UPI000AE1CB5B|nr:hypothetical protein [Nitratireductor aquibiodomus]